MNTKLIVRKFQVLIFTVFSILAISSSCLAETYYVDNENGSDANNGLSIALAWKTISKINASEFQPGDQILFATDRTWREQLTIPTSGLPGNPITFGAYGSGEKPIISGGSFIAGEWTQFSGNSYSISTSLWVDRGGHARIFFGSTQLTQNSSSDLSANQYYFEYSDTPGTSGKLISGTLYVNIGNAPGATDIEANVRKKTIEINKNHITIVGIHLTKAAFGVSQYTAQSDNVIVRDCNFDFCITGIYCGQSTTSNASGWLVEYCSFSNNGQNNVYDQTLYIKFCSNWIIQNNTFKNNGAYAININGSSNNIIRYNYSEGNGAGFLEFYEDTAGGSQNNQVYYNISNNDKGFIYSGGGLDHSGNIVYNNVIYGSSYGVCIDAGNLSAFRNNILWSSKSNAKYFSVSPGASITSSSNNIIGPFGSGTVISYQGSGYTSLAAFKGAFSSLEVNSISDDPLFVNAGTDFHLSNSSPCRDSGGNFSLPRDFDGNILTYVNKPDIGAYQYQEKKPNPPTNLHVQ